MATLGLTEQERKAVEEFRRDVVEPSRSSLIVVDFWAEWCGPCKQLAPVIEKVCEEYARKGVKLVKINVDENQFIASQFRVQSIPTVYAVFQGQPVADLTSARTEGALRQMLDQILAQLPIQSEDRDQAEQIEPLLAMGEEVLAAGDAARATSIFAQILDMAPHSAEAASGLVRALIGEGQVDAAREVLDGLEPDLAGSPVMDRARAALDLASQSGVREDTSALEAQVAAEPANLDARLELARAFIANRDHQQAADHLLAIIEQDRDWNDGAARKQLLTLFEAVGLEDPWVATQRRRLSALLFG